jgi:hypothetical protein
MSESTFTSTAPAAEDELVARLQAWAPDDVLVLPNLPTEVPSDRSKRIYFAGMEDQESEVRLSPRIEVEGYVLVFAVEAQTLGKDGRQPARDAAYALADAISAVIEEDPELIPGGKARRSGIPKLATLPTEDGWLSNGLVHVVVASLT